MIMRLSFAYAADMAVETAVAMTAAYALGMFPTALLVGRCIGRHPTSEGSGNPGASNMCRIGGLKAGFMVGIVDVAKGALPVWAALVLLGQPETHPAALAAWLGAMVGHVWPVLGLLPGLNGRIKGGKGVATTFGGALVLNPLLGLTSLAIFAAILAWTRVAALASLGSLFAYLVMTILSGAPARHIAAAGVVAFVVVLRHRSNLTRMRHGTELNV